MGRWVPTVQRKYGIDLSPWIQRLYIVMKYWYLTARPLLLKRGGLILHWIVAAVLSILFICFISLKSSRFTTAGFIFLESKFSTKDKVNVHLEANGWSVISEEFSVTPDQMGNCACLTLHLDTSALSDTGQSLCELETDVPSVLHV